VPSAPTGRAGSGCRSSAADPPRVQLISDRGATRARGIEVLGHGGSSAGNAGKPSPPLYGARVRRLRSRHDEGVWTPSASTPNRIRTGDFLREGRAVGSRQERGSPVFTGVCAPDMPALIIDIRSDSSGSATLSGTGTQSEALPLRVAANPETVGAPTKVRRGLGRRTTLAAPARMTLSVALAFPSQTSRSLRTVADPTWTSYPPGADRDHASRSHPWKHVGHVPAEVTAVQLGAADL
jgi:hypothetical protein